MTDNGTPTPESAIEKPGLVSPDTALINPTQYLHDLFRESLDHQRRTYPGYSVLTFDAQQVPNWYIGIDPNVRSLSIGSVTGFSAFPFLSVPTDLKGGFIAETPAGFLGVALHHGNKDLNHEQSGLRLEYAIANERETPWIFTENYPSTVKDLSTILYALGAKGMFEIGEENRLVVWDPTNNYPGNMADTKSSEGQRAWLSEEGVTRGVAAIQRLVDLIARDKSLPRNSNTLW